MANTFPSGSWRKPNLSTLKIIGSLSYVLIKNQRDRPTRMKIQDKAIKGWLVGLNATNIYKVWIPHLDRVVVSRDVQVGEKVMYDPQLTIITLESRQSSLNAINEVDLDESDVELFPTMDDTVTNPDIG
jgi:hypothetical protein